MYFYERYGIFIGSLACSSGSRRAQCLSLRCRVFFRSVSFGMEYSQVNIKFCFGFRSQILAPTQQAFGLEILWVFIFYIWWRWRQRKGRVPTVPLCWGWIRDAFLNFKFSFWEKQEGTEQFATCSIPVRTDSVNNDRFYY